MNLAAFVKKRNGAPLGTSNSLSNMLSRSLGAGKFSVFWQYWNPIWSYFLGKYIFKPIKKVLPNSIALVLTFAISGFIHDIAIMLVRMDYAFLFTPWFTIMSFWILISEAIGFEYSKYPWTVRALINILIIGCCFMLAYQLKV